jgi:putative oxidoreductase
MTGVTTSSSTTPGVPNLRQGNSSFAISVALLILRLAMGWVFIHAGSQKLFGAFGGIGMSAWIQNMEKMNLPLLPPVAWAYMAACGEFFGGVFVFLGALTRLASIPLIITMLVAIATVTGQKGFGGYAYNLVLIAISVALMIAGPGLISVDAVLFRRGLWARGPQPLSDPGPKR